MGDFSRHSNFNSKSNFKSVRIGADCPVLETELNEMQDISEQRYKDLVSHFVGDGVSGEGQFLYSDNLLTVVNEKAFVSGHTVDITTLTLPLQEGEKAYLKVWEETLSHNDPIKLNGNQQETKLIPNTMLDARVGRETSKRIQVQYDLSTTTDEDPKYSYLYLGQVVEGRFIVQCSLKTLNESFFIDNYTSDGSTGIFCTTHCFVQGANTLQIFVDGVLQLPFTDYKELSPNVFQLMVAPKVGATIVAHYRKAIVSQATEGHAVMHSKVGGDPLDINQLADEENLLGKLRVVSNCAIILDGGHFNDPLLDEDETIYDGGGF